MVICSRERMENKIKTFAAFGDTGKGGITRFSLSSEALSARAEFSKRMQAIGATVVTDDMANMYATLPGTEDLPALAAGSHLDSVRQGGNYDGVLGVLSAMETLETIVLEQLPHRHPLTAIVWTNEEGARFEPAMMSSGVICGKFEKAKMLASVAKDIPGYTFGEALEKSGYLGDIANRLVRGLRNNFRQRRGHQQVSLVGHDEPPWGGCRILLWMFLQRQDENFRRISDSSDDFLHERAGQRQPLREAL